MGNDETQFWKAYYTTTHDEDLEEDFDLYCLYNSMFTKEEIELQCRQDLLKTILSRGLGWRMHCSAEVTESSTNKQHHLSGVFGGEEEGGVV